VWIETPSNPLVRVVDIHAIAQAAHAAGALVAADNTFLSPLWQQPLALGADLVVHSTTKYLNGHSDVVGGAVIAATAELAQNLAWWANAIGVTGSPFDSFLSLRGLRTWRCTRRMRPRWSNACGVTRRCARYFIRVSPIIRGTTSHGGNNRASARC
jgi:cystathionine gamma-synthase